MKKSIAIITVLVAGFLAGSGLIMSCDSKHKHSEGEEQGQKMDSTAVVYACPMHPEVTGKEGDKCNKCGMKLEAVKSTDSTKADNHE